MRQFGLLFVVVGGLCACRPPTPTLGFVHLFEASGDAEVFRHCQIKLKWALQELIDHCGMPDRFVAEAGDPEGFCAVYPTDAATFAGGTGAESIVACLERSRWDNAELKQQISVKGFEDADLSGYRVHGVYGVRAGEDLAVGDAHTPQD